MPQNPTSNKFSSYVGIILLLFVVAFTILINFVEEKGAFKTEEIEEEIYFEPFDSWDIDNFWKLEKLQTEIITSDDGLQTLIEINKNLRTVSYDSTIDLHSDQFNSIRKKFEKDFNDDYRLEFGNSKIEFVVNYGILDFAHTYYTAKDNRADFDNVKINYLNTVQTDSVQLTEIGNLLLEYQIQSISTNIMYGDFTHIILKDGREIFLLKENAEVAEEYKSVLENAEYWNDSTFIIQPWK